MNTKPQTNELSCSKKQAIMILVSLGEAVGLDGSGTFLSKATRR